MSDAPAIELARLRALVDADLRDVADQEMTAARVARRRPGGGCILSS